MTATLPAGPPKTQPKVQRDRIPHRVRRTLKRVPVLQTLIPQTPAPQAPAPVAAQMTVPAQPLARRLQNRVRALNPRLKTVLKMAVWPTMMIAAITVAGVVRTRAKRRRLRLMTAAPLTIPVITVVPTMVLATLVVLSPVLMNPAPVNPVLMNLAPVNPALNQRPDPLTPVHPPVNRIRRTVRRTTVMVMRCLPQTIVLRETQVYLSRHLTRHRNPRRLRRPLPTTMAAAFLTVRVARLMGRTVLNPGTTGQLIRARPTRKPRLPPAVPEAITVRGGKVKSVARAGLAGCLACLLCSFGTGGFAPPFYARAAPPVKVVGLKATGLGTAGLKIKGSTKEPSRVSAERVDDQRLVTFFFSEGAWGGLPFSEAEKQHVMVDAMVTGKPVHIEVEVTHLLSAPQARVRRFVALFEVDGSVRPPVMRSGYELELLVPHSRKALSVELENGETGVVNRVEVEPDGSL